MKFNRQVLCNLVLSSALIGLPALAADPNNADQGQGASPPSGVVSLSDKKDCKKPCGIKSTLTDDQLEKIAAMKDNFLTKTSAKKAELRTLGRQLRGLLTKKDVNRQEAFALQDKISTLRADLAKEKLAFRLDMMSVLTDEQRDSLRHRMLMKQAFGGHHHHGRHFACGGQKGGFRKG